jgi:hypothetical protein
VLAASLNWISSRVWLGDVLIEATRSAQDNKLESCQKDRVERLLQG